MPSTGLRPASWIALAAAALGLAGEVAPRPAWAAKDAPVSAAAPAISPAELEEAIRARRLKVPEYGKIAEMAKARGLRAYLFGGTASGLAHYVKWDLMREKGDKRFQPDRFDYDYTNIYRSNQDLDIVIARADGSAETIEEIQEFQKAVAERFPYAQGNKTDWEVRGLRTKNGTKEAILDNPDFMNQHTDSNSVGLIELTEPKEGSILLDLRDPESKIPTFLKDVSEGKIHYYFSPTHARTSRAAQGLNPPIISAIRYLTKAFQYELKMDSESRKRIQAIVRGFNPRDPLDPYVAKWIEKNGKKLFQNAVSIEYAWDTLEELGLRKKLLELKGNLDEKGSLAWWMNKEPLRSGSRPLDPELFPKVPKGKTAKELGIDIVAHETSDFEAYESITRSHQGRPNVLISRQGVIGESAADGAGFYTQKGKKGARQTGFHIRFKVDPSAREGVDFSLFEGERYIVWKRSDRLHVIPESMGMDPVAAVEFLTDPANRDEEALKTKLMRRLSSVGVSQEKKDAFVSWMKRLPEGEWEKFGVAMSFPFTAEYPELLKIAPKRAEYALHEHWLKRAEVKPFLASAFRAASAKDAYHFLQAFFTKPSSEPFLDAAIPLLEKVRQGNPYPQTFLVREFLTAPHIVKSEKIIHWLAKQPMYWDALLTGYFSQAASARDTDLLVRIIQESPQYERSFDSAFTNPVWSRQWELVEKVYRKLLPESFDNAHFTQSVLGSAGAAEKPELLERLFALNRRDVDKPLLEWIVSNLPENSNDLALRILARGKMHPKQFVEITCGSPIWRGPNRAKMLDLVLAKDSEFNAEGLLLYFFRNHPSPGPENDDILQRALRYRSANIDMIVLNHVLTRPDGRRYESLLDSYAKRKGFDYVLAETLANPIWNHRSDLRQKLMKTQDPQVLKLFARELYAKPKTAEVAREIPFFVASLDRSRYQKYMTKAYPALSRYLRLKTKEEREVYLSNLIKPLERAAKRAGRTAGCIAAQLER